MPIYELNNTQDITGRSSTEQSYDAPLSPLDSTRSEVFDAELNAITKGGQSWSEGAGVHDLLNKQIRELQDITGEQSTIELPSEGAVLPFLRGELQTDGQYLKDAHDPTRYDNMGYWGYEAQWRSFLPKYDELKRKAIEENPEYKPLTLDELRNKTAEDAAAARVDSEQVSSRASNTGRLLGQGGAGVVQAGREPANWAVAIATMPVALEVFTGNIVRTIAIAGLEGMAGVVSERSIQNSMMDFYQRQGMTLEQAQATANRAVLSAGVGGAVAGPAFYWMFKGLGKAFKGTKETVGEVIYKQLQSGDPKQIQKALALYRKTVSNMDVDTEQQLNILTRSAEIHASIPESLKGNQPLINKAIAAIDEATIKLNDGDTGGILKALQKHLGDTKEGQAAIAEWEQNILGKMGDEQGFEQTLSDVINKHLDQIHADKAAADVELSKTTPDEIQTDTPTEAPQKTNPNVTEEPSGQKSMVFDQDPKTNGHAVYGDIKDVQVNLRPTRVVKAIVLKDGRTLVDSTASTTTEIQKNLNIVKEQVARSGWWVDGKLYGTRPAAIKRVKEIPDDVVDKWVQGRVEADMKANKTPSKPKQEQLTRDEILSNVEKDTIRQRLADKKFDQTYSVKAKADLDALVENKHLPIELTEALEKELDSVTRAGDAARKLDKSFEHNSAQAIEHLQDTHPEIADQIRFKIVELTKDGQAAEVIQAASVKLVKQITENIKWKQFQTELKIIKTRSAMDRVTDFTKGVKSQKTRGQRVYDALRSLYTYNTTGKRNVTNIEFYGHSIELDLLSLAPSLSKLRPKVFSWSLGALKSMNEDIRRAAMGLPVNNKDAVQIAKELQDVFAKAVDLYRERGGRLNKLDGWFLPQVYDSHKLLNQNGKNISVKDFISDMMGEGVLDRARMIDHITGVELTDKEVKQLLEHTYAEATDEGMSKFIEFDQFGTDIASKHMDHRVIHFTPEGHQSVARKYTRQDTINETISWIKRMSQDISVLEHLGPQPHKTFELLQGVLAKESGGSKAAKTRFEYHHQEQVGGGPSIQNEKIYDLDRTFRAGTLSAVLGSSPVSTITDMAVATFAQAMRGTNFFTDYLPHFLTALRNAEGSTEILLREKLGIEMFISDSVVSTRALGEKGARASGIVEKGLQATLEKGGMNAMTTAGRKAAVLTELTKFGRDIVRQKVWTKLSKARRSHLTTYGITEKEWDEVMLKMDTTNLGANLGIWQRPYLKLQSLADADPELFKRVHTSIIRSAYDSVLSTDANVEVAMRAIASSEKKGTGGDVAVNQIRMLKRFAMSTAVLVQSFMRNENYSVGQKAGAMSKYIVAMGIWGAVTVQLHQLIRGRELIPMVDEDGNLNTNFIYKAYAYGAGIGIVVEVAKGIYGLANDGVEALSKQSRGQSSVFDAFPTAGWLQTAGKGWSWKQLDEAIENKDPEKFGQVFGSLGLNVAEMAVDVTPLNHWLFMSLKERLMDSGRAFINPDAADRATEWQRRYLRDNLQEFYWEPDQLLPERMPDFGRAKVSEIPSAITNLTDRINN